MGTKVYRFTVPRIGLETNCQVALTTVDGIDNLVIVFNENHGQTDTKLVGKTLGKATLESDQSISNPTTSGPIAASNNP